MRTGRARSAAADLVLVATPVGEFPALFEALAGQLARACDRHRCGQHQGERDRRGAHAPRRRESRASCRAIRSPAPSIAARHAAFATLFRDRNVVLTPGRDNGPRRRSRPWRACGRPAARRCASSIPPSHDRIFAAVSHLPHVLAFALVDLLAARPDADEVFRYAASGFRDFTRIAAGSPEMWRDISLANRDALLAGIDAYRATARRGRRDGRRGRRRALEALFRARVRGAARLGRNLRRAARRTRRRLARTLAWRPTMAAREHPAVRIPSTSRRWLAPSGTVRVAGLEEHLQSHAAARRARAAATRSCADFSTPTTWTGCWTRSRRSASTSKR